MGNEKLLYSGLEANSQDKTNHAMKTGINDWKLFFLGSILFEVTTSKDVNHLYEDLKGLKRMDFCCVLGISNIGANIELI